MSHLGLRGSSISRYAKGVYRIDVVSSMLEEEVLVAWTSIDPRRCPGDITGEDMSVATGATASWLYGIGKFGLAH